ncbi:polysaccharide biosynthesis C-terminal domain-containing protein [Gracilimonas sediminicola]|uniref:Polysaccharide biosynthesis C-terminal domain-containing protein n=1 Tax=Gracilimonas sediminicola TaxID=2952158 RepID=A0A9X2RCV0_9BACT|nr:polysaccharide biosynthesis C-terminal domain-containing protein [Gracilimonas sediminicola]MCP9290981.1 polysaccharide biosynthesis C-terminal domain-containing protein [Gracilimonas sediminicola]
MGIIIKQSLRNAIISYIGIIIGFVTTIQLYPHILEADQFGLTRILIAISTISVQIITFGIPNSVIKFFPALSKKTDNPSGIFWAFLIPPAIGFLAYSLILIFFRDFVISFYDSGSGLLEEYYLYIIPLVLFTVSFSVLNSFVKAQFNTVFASFLQDIFLRVMMILDLVLFYFDFITFDTFMLIFIGSYALLYLLLFGYALKEKLLNFKPVLQIFDKDTREKIRSYSFYSFFSGLTMLLIGNIDLIMVGTFNGLEQTGIYAIALYVGSVITVPKKSITKISFPVIAAAFQRNDIQNVKEVYKQTSLNQFLTGLIIYIGVIANIDNLYEMLPKEYVDGSIVIIIIGLGNLLEMVTGANGQIIIASKYFRFDFYSSWILVILAITLNAVLIPMFGLQGAALATAASIFTYNIIKVIFVWVKFKMQPFTWNLLGLLATGIAILLLSYLVPQFENIYVDIAIRSICMAAVYFAAVWIFKLSDEVNNFISEQLKRVLKN